MHCPTPGTPGLPALGMATIRCLGTRASPSDGRSRRGVVVAPDIGGLRPLFDDLCQRLADDHGWAVCAPEPWPGPGATSRSRSGSPRSARWPTPTCSATSSAAADATGVEPVGIIGFCMGGMYTLKAAGTGRFDRAVAFYGMIRLPEQWRGRPRASRSTPVGADGAAPVLAIIGTDDIWTPAGRRRRARGRRRRGRPLRRRRARLRPRPRPPGAPGRLRRRRVAAGDHVARRVSCSRSVIW